MAGGGDGSMEKAIDTAECLLHKMNAEVIGTACSHNTENISPLEDKEAMEDMKNIAKQFYELHNKFE